MFQSNISPFAGLVRVIMTLVSIGVVVGLTLSQSDLTNFITNSARAQAITRQTEIEAEQAEIDLQNYRALKAAEAEVEQARLQAEAAADARSLDIETQFKAQKAIQDLEIERLTGYTWLVITVTAAGLLVLCAGIGLTIALSRIIYSRLIAMSAPPVQANPWRDPMWRKEQIQMARHHEKLMRQPAEQTISVPVDSTYLWPGIRQSDMVPTTPKPQPEKEVL